MKLMIILVFMVLAWLTGAKADDAPCPPKHYFCWEARWAFSHYGVSRVVSKAKACGWTREEIAEALKCK